MSKSQVAVAALAEMDPQFAELVEVLFGKSVDARDVWQFVYTPEGVAKMLEVDKAAPSQSDLNATGRGRKKKRGALVSAGGVAGTAAVLGGAAAIPGVRRGAKAFVHNKRYPKGETHVGDFSRFASDSYPSTATPGERGLVRYRKSDDAVDVVWEGTFSKLDDEKRVAFGWASVVSVDGEPVVDKQGDLIDWEDLEKAAYAYVMKSRKGGSQHRRDGEEPFHASDMIESFVVTPEKIEKMHLPPETPVGWWVGYHYHDEDTWQDIKKGHKTGFSVHGRGKRRPMEVDA
jgi:hypothetical protein